VEHGGCVTLAAGATMPAGADGSGIGLGPQRGYKVGEGGGYSESGDAEVGVAPLGLVLPDGFEEGVA
jgi:hypothetical protein